MTDEAASDATFMARAIELAREAARAGEVPVGAVLVRDGRILGEGSNAPIGHHDPSAHAEILALRAAAEAIGNYRLPNTTLYVTVEPCTMCAGALVHARVSRLVFGAREPRAGAVLSNTSVLGQVNLNHHVEVEEGVRTEECAALMREFFAARR